MPLRVRFCCPMLLSTLLQLSALILSAGLQLRRFESTFFPGTGVKWLALPCFADMELLRLEREFDERWGPGSHNELLSALSLMPQLRTLTLGYMEARPERW